IEVLQFWMMSPFLPTPTGAGNTTGGQMYFDLGSVSEDILKDGKKEFENGLNTPNINSAIDNSSVWGRVPANPIQVTTAFSNDAADRPFQDVGLDGMSDTAEQVKFQVYLNQMQARVGAAAYQTALADPSSDDFVNYRDASYDAAHVGILGRYKSVNNPQGNSPIATTGSTTISAYTLYPDQEDLNKDNTMNTLEEYFEYRVNLNPDSMKVGTGFITDQQTFTPSGSNIAQTWYQFRIPISEYYQKVGNIPDFKSIQFMRMYLTGFTDSVVCRFAQLQLVRNSWRSFDYVIDTTGNYTLLPVNNTTLNVTAVNIEQNSGRTPIPYVTPPGVLRQQELSNNNVNLLLNEQAMSLQICNLVQGDIRGVYKTTNLDLRRYGTMDMFVHAEATGVASGISDYDLSAVIRLGSDFTSNYYEIRIPLVHTAWNPQATDVQVWPDSNNLNLSLSRLIQLKVDRNNQGVSNVYFKETAADGRTYAILGNPNLGAIQAFFLGVQNVRLPNACAEIWFNELRLTDISEQGGWAAVGKVDMKLADLGTMTVSGSNRSAGFGAIDQSTNERSLDNNSEVDAAANLELGKMLPKKAAISVPVYAGVTRTVSTPEYDPFDLDIKLKDKINAAPASQKDSIRKQAVDATTVTTVNFTNVHKNNTTNKKLKIWSIENINVSYSYNRSDHHSPLAVEDDLVTNKATFAYNYTHTAKYWEPFKKKIKSKSPWLALVRDFNFNPMPTVLGFQANAVRQFGAYRSRNIGGPADILPETFNKFFTFDRLYTLRWDLTRSLAFDFTATNKAWVDEDSGRLSKEGRKRMWDNFWKGGRTILYTQSANATYTLPTGKIPALDWTSVKAGYSATYTWTGASQLALTQGNSIMNTQQRIVTADLDFTRLYSKWKLLRSLDTQPPKNNNTGAKNPQDSARNAASQKFELKGVTKGLARLLTSLKHINLQYNDNSSSSIFGYLDSTRALGMNFQSMEPGWGYVFGQRADTNMINKLGRKGLISTDTTFNN
ncbi:MAG TPA: cell surface protein SprA, partial [Puia sp.]|nr:cell surface protein SprA [Puia sp.]